VTRTTAVLSALDAAASTVASGRPLLITGEPGTGRATLAHLLARLHGRDAELGEVDCAALEPDPRGGRSASVANAFCDRLDHWCRASGSTAILLRNLHVLSPRGQGSLARCLNVMLSNAGRPFVVATADREELVRRQASAGFSEELARILGGTSIELLPLRERRADIAPLVDHFMEVTWVGRRPPYPVLSEDALSHLAKYPWRSGNVDELKRVVASIEREVGASHSILEEHLPTELRS
jgi:DNA-binding NtrC family response regulator